MPGSHFTPVLNIVDNGFGICASGPLTIDDDSSSIRVVAVVTQDPSGGKPAEGAAPDTAICHGDVHLDATEVDKQRATKNPMWHFTARSTENVQFREGWARGIAVALSTTKQGDIETYSWSEWVWLNP